MNCRKFETIIGDLARVSMMDAETRMMGLAHAESCARCATRLADEKALTSGLRAVGASVVAKEAPARVEAALLAAFRAGGNLESGARPNASGAAVVLPMPHRARHNWSWRAGAAVAAAVLFTVTLSLLRLQPQQPPQEQAASSSQPESTPLTGRSEIEQSGQTASNASFNEALTGAEGVQTDIPEPLAPALNRESRGPHRFAPVYQTASMNRPTHRGGPGLNGSGGMRTVNAGSNAGEGEVATDFMPLTYDGGAMAMESGHVVRVELPRSALLSMGLPMNPERAGEPVKADVLMGDDGVARAIRFVR